jgi:hypothetical protein
VPFVGAISANGHVFNRRTNELAVARRDRTVALLDGQSLAVRRKSEAFSGEFSVEGTGQLFAMMYYDDDHLLCPSDNGVYRLINTTTGALEAAVQGPARALLLRWGRPYERLWMAAPGELRSVCIAAAGKIKPPPPPSASQRRGSAGPSASSAATSAPAQAASQLPRASPVLATSAQVRAVTSATDVRDHVLSFNLLGCVGLSFNYDGTMAAVGDLGGNVCVWQVGRTLPLYAAK